MFSALTKMISKAAKIIKLLLAGRASLYSPPIHETVIFDISASAEIAALPGNAGALLFDPRFENRVFLAPLLQGIMDWVSSSFSFSITHHYFVRVLLACQPELVVTGSYFSADYYSARSAVSKRLESVFVVFQTGLWSDTNPPPVSDQLCSRDIVFALTAAHAAAWRKLSTIATILNAGSLKAKTHSGHMVTPTNDRSAAWVSVWRNEKTSLERHGKFASSHNLEHTNLWALKSALNRLGYRLDVIPSRKMADANDEFKFYSSILGSEGWNFINRSADDNVYRLLTNYRFLFGAGSTLLYEALSLEQRVMFLDTSSASPQIVAFAYPDDVNHSDSLLLLKSEQSMDWDSQILEVADLAPSSFRALAAGVVGEGALGTSLETIELYLQRARGEVRNWS